MKKLKTYKLFENQTIKEYPFKEISAIVKWFDKKYIKQANKEGWLISLCQLTNLHNWGTRYVFQIQKIDEPDDEYLELESDEVAASLAKRWGFICDEENVVYDFNMDIFKNRIKFKTAFDLNLL